LHARHEAARVHHAFRRRGYVAACGARAAKNLADGWLLFSGTLETNGDEVAGLRRGMSETGFIEGRNVAVEYRWGAPLSALDLPAADLVNRRVTVIAANTAGAALRAKAATASIPIVFAAFADAVKVGLVTNLGRTVMSPESI